MLDIDEKELIYDLALYAGTANDEELKALFATDAQPAAEQIPMYNGGKYYFSPVSHTESGGVWTLKVKVKDFNSGAELGDVEWKAKKEGDAWKLFEAPLP